MNEFLTHEQYELLKRLSTKHVSRASLSNKEQTVLKFLKDNGLASSVGFGDMAQITEEGRSYLQTFFTKEKRYISDHRLAVGAIIISILSLVISFATFITR